jgi:hypothetical protein
MVESVSVAVMVVVSFAETEGGRSESDHVQFLGVMGDEGRSIAKGAMQGDAWFHWVFEGY